MRRAFDRRRSLLSPFFVVFVCCVVFPSCDESISDDDNTDGWDSFVYGRDNPLLFLLSLLSFPRLNTGG